ncbi:hypothetical protein [Promicromonospora sukumoe]|uniref:hypothetical protein n=1 Tax=Promicromonospora sukumoe TaxID=88382 RepID=UPI00035CB9D1|nr:hypothetical protein [Promicromonospora sukumoe]
MRRPSVFNLVIAALALVGVAAAVTAAVEGSVALVLTGVGLALLAAVAYLTDRRSRAGRRSLELLLKRGFEGVRQDLTELASPEDLVEVTERLDRLDARLEKAQRRLVAASDAARLEAAERASRVNV